jgi:hypothetical protein
MKIEIEFIKDGFDWEKGDTGQVIKLINQGPTILAVIILDKDGKFVTSLLVDKAFKRVVY